MRTSRVINESKNNSIFGMGARQKEKEDRVRSQMFAFKDDTDLGDKGVYQKPVIKMAFAREDGSLIKKKGLEYESGGRIFKTDDDGCLTLLNTSYVKDRQAEAADERDLIFGLVQTFLDIENDDIVAELLGKTLWDEMAQPDKDCRPSTLSGMPVDSLVFAQGVARLKNILKRRNFCPDEAISMTSGLGAKNSSGGANVYDIKALVGAQDGTAAPPSKSLAD